MVFLADLFSLRKSRHFPLTPLLEVSTDLSIIETQITRIFVDKTIFCDWTNSDLLINKCSYEYRFICLLFYCFVVSTVDRYLHFPGFSSPK